MKYTLFFVLLSTGTLCCNTSGYNTKATSYGNWSGAPKELILDAWIKTYELGIPDSLIVRTEQVKYYPEKIPYSEKFKFTIRTAILDTVFLESKESNKKQFFIFTKKRWGNLKPLH